MIWGLRGIDAITRALPLQSLSSTLKGSLESGKLADVTVLSRDIMTIPEDEIPATDIVYTIVGGKVVFDRTAAPR